MNKTAFAVVCMTCAVAAAVIVARRLAQAFPARDFLPAILLVLVVLPALAWLNLRFAAPRKGREAEFETMVREGTPQLAHVRSPAAALEASRKRRRLFAAGEMLAVGLCLSLAAPQIVLKGTKIPGGWPIALSGATALCGELIGVNWLRGTPLDRRLDPQSPGKHADLNQEPKDIKK